MKLTNLNEAFVNGTSLLDSGPRLDRWVKTHECGQWKVTHWKKARWQECTKRLQEKVNQNINSWHLWNTYMAEIILRNLHKLTHVILTIIPWEKYCETLFYKSSIWSPRAQAAGNELSHDVCSRLPAEILAHRGPSLISTETHTRTHVQHRFPGVLFFVAVSAVYFLKGDFHKLISNLCLSF